MKEKGKKVGRKVFKVLTGVIVGSAIGSILGLTLAPKKGEETRKYLRDKSLELFLKGEAEIRDDQKIGFFKKIIIKLLTRKKR